MSQLADLEAVVLDTPLTTEQQAKLFVDILDALEWEVDGVSTPQDAIVYFGMRGRG